MMCMAYLIVMICPLTSCNDDKGNTITKGEVLDQIMDAFCMYQYEQQEPYAEKVAKDNPHFRSVQTAFEWGVIDDEKINVNDKATKGFLAEALVKCVGFKDTDDMSSDDIVQYAVDNEYVSFKYRGRTDSKRNVTPDEAAESISDSAAIWSNHKFEEKEEIKYGDGVVDLAKENVTAKDILVEEGNNNNMVLPVSMADKIKEGSTFIIPAEEGVSEARVVKADQVETQGNRLMVKTSPAEYDTAIENLDASGSFTPDLTQSRIVDGVGNVLEFEDESQQQTSNQIDDISNKTIDDNSLNNCFEPTIHAKSKKLEFTISDDIKVSGTVKDDSISFSISGTLWKSEKERAKLTATKSFEIKDIGFDYDYNISWFKVESAYAKLKYTTVDTGSIAFSYTKDWVAAPKYSNGNGKFLTNFKRSIIKDSKSKGAKTIKICSIPIVHGGIASVNLDVKVKISVTGSIEVSVTTENVKGIQYKKGCGVRLIKEQHQESKITAKGKLEATLYAGVSFRAVGFNIIGFGIEGGIGCAFSYTAYLTDDSNHLLEKEPFDDVNVEMCDQALKDANGIDYSHEKYGNVKAKCVTCYDRTPYWILKFTIDTDCIVKKFIKGNVEFTILDSENGKIKALCKHVENGVEVNECTRNFKDDADSSGSDSSSDSSSNKNDNSSKATANTLDIDTYFVNLGIGDTYKLSLEDIPEGYDKKDVEFVSDDNKIARVTGDGTITGASGGLTNIRVQTKDKKYSVECAVYVVEAAKTSQSVTQA